MSLTELAGTRPELSGEQRKMVLDAMRSLLDSPHFCKSKRYMGLLEFAVRAALEQNPEPLKERTVGAMVFGRPLDYDTSVDPVVRVAAGEVRRRMALYSSEHLEDAVRIELPHGSYKADFHFRPPAGNEGSLKLQPALIFNNTNSAQPHTGKSESWTGQAYAPVTTLAPKSTPRRWISMPRFALGAMLVLLVAGAGLWRYRHDREQRGFWGPVLHNNQPALILVGKFNLPASADAASGQSQPVVSRSSAAPDLALNDAIVTAQICSVFREYERECNIAQANLANLEDLHGKSVVLVGAFNNPWTRLLLEPLPYQFKRDGGREIVEHKPTEDIVLGRIVGPDDLSADFAKDYAIVARFHSNITDSVAVVVAGLGLPGTSSAEQYASSSDKFREILSLAPRNWSGTNFEAVLQIDVVHGSPNHVKVIGSRFW